MHPTTFSIADWQQAEQTAGYWLISLTLTDPVLFDVGTVFWLDSNPEPLRLFHQELQSNNVKLQLLSSVSIMKTTSPGQLHCRPPKTSTTIPVSGNLLILGSGLEMANLFYIAKKRQASHASAQTLALLHSEQRFPFPIKPSRFILPEMPLDAIGASPLLEDWKIANRLASELGLPGCFEGSLAELLGQWIQYHHQSETQTEKWQILACLPKEMQKKCLEVCQSIDWLNFTGITYNA
jgi:hypothetical protein